ncbi:MAG: tetratricopeptide repeat protein [Omnitrophica WOR_2 bacterium]
MLKAKYFYILFFLVLFQLTIGDCFASEIDRNRLNELNIKAENALKNSPDEAIKVLKEVLESSKDEELIDIRARALKNMGKAHFFKQNLRQSLEYNEQALLLYRKLDDKDGIATILNNTGLIYERQADYSNALSRYNEASKLFSKLDDSKKKLSIALSNIGNVYYTLGRLDLALQFMTQALKTTESLSDSIEMAPIYINIGNIYHILKEYKTAIQYYNKSEKIYIKYNEKKELGVVYNNLGEAYLNLNNISSSLKYNQLSLEISNKNNDNEGVITSLISISRIYTKIKEYNLAMTNYQEALRISGIKSDKFLVASILQGIGELKYNKGEYDDAVASYKDALAIIEKSGSDPLIQEIYSGISKAYAAKGNYQRAYEFMKKHEDITDTIYNHENLNRLNMIRVSFELEQTERDNQLLRQQNIYSQLALNRQQTIRNLFIVITAIVLVSLAFLFLLYHSKKKKNELLALRNKQISKQKEELDKLYLEQFKLNETKTKFFSIVAHDLKSPFQSLLGFTELLSLEYDQFTDEQRLDAITNMYKVTSDTYKLIENLLEWGRIQTGNANVIPKYINIKDLVDSIVPIFELPLKNKNLKLSIEIPPLLMAHADPNMMGAIFRNLLSNAVKFSNAGGTIFIKGNSTVESAKLSITDSGIGIAPAMIDKLFTFDPKIRRIGTKGETGTGMGLGLCMEFMQLNHGMIKVKSEPNKGSTFTMIMQPGSKVTIHDPVSI